MNVNTLVFLDDALRKNFTYKDSYETQVRAHWETGSITYYVVVVWDTEHQWIVKQRIARIDHADGMVKFAYFEKWE